MAKSGRLELGDNIRSIFNHGDVIVQQSNRIPWKVRKIRAITAFKVIEVGTNQKPVCDWLVINSNWHPISYRFGVITAAYCSNFGHCVFEPLSPWGLRDNVRCRSLESAYGSGLLISVNWTFFNRSYGWGATCENRSKIGDFPEMRSVWPKMQVEGAIIFARIVRPMNALQLLSLTVSHKETL